MRFLRKLVGKRRFWCYKVWKLEEVSHEMLVLVLPRVSSRVSGFRVASPCLLFEGFQAGCHVVLHGRRGTLWHSNLFDNASKLSKLEEVSRTKCSFCCAHVSRLECLVFLWCRHVYGEAAKTLLVEGFQAGCHVVLRGRRGTLWHSNLFDNVSNVKIGGNLARNAPFSAPTCLVSSLWFSCGVAVSIGEAPHSTLYTLHSTLHNLHFRLLTTHSTLYTLHSTLYTPHSSLDTLHSTLHTLHSTLHTLHFTLYTLHSTLHTLHFTLHTLHFTLHTLHF